jgi:hypothetical protein
MLHSIIAIKNQQGLFQEAEKNGLYNPEELQGTKSKARNNRLNFAPC